MSAGTTPWNHRRWRGGVCRPELGGAAGLLWFLALCFCAAVAGIAWKAPEMLHFALVRWKVLIPGGCGVVGVLFTVFALKATARWLRFGRCVVRPVTLPGVIGGRFRGELLLPADFPAGTDVRLELACETTTTTPGTGKDDGTRVEVARAWARTVCLTVSDGFRHDGSCAVPFDFIVPYGLPDETNSREEGRVRIDVAWRLRAFARLRGPDLNITYTVPVFVTCESDPNVRDAPPGEQNLDALLHNLGEYRRVRFELIDGANTCICSARGMKAGLSIVPGVFGLAFLGGAVLAAWNGVPALFHELLAKAEGWMNLFKLFPLVMLLGLFLLVTVLTLAGLLLLFLAVHGAVSRRTWVRHGAVHQRLSLLGIPCWRTLPCRDATDVNRNDATSSGTKTWYDVVIESRPGVLSQHIKPLYLFRRLTVATGVPTEQEAGEIVARLRREIGLLPPKEEAN
jgi:hypothetical protein